MKQKSETEKNQNQRTGETEIRAVQHPPGSYQGAHHRRPPRLQNVQVLRKRNLQRRGMR